MIHLVLGGARSGKSSFAESQASNFESLNSECSNSDSSNSEYTVVYIATATAQDSEMEQRILHHKKSRPAHWKVVEESLYLSKEIQNASSNEVILIDCLTLWLTNWLCLENKEGFQKEKEEFIAALESTSANVLIVSNEVGSGIVPLGELSREFVDLAGWLNQSIAKVANKVSLIVAGCEVKVKTDRIGSKE